MSERGTRAPVTTSQLVAQDAVFFVAFALVYGTAGYVAVLVARALCALGGVAGAFGSVLAAPVVVFSAVVPVAVLHRVLPPIRPGIYRVRDRVFLWWVLRFVLQRQLNLWPLRQVLFYSNLLRWFVLNALGSRVHATTRMSSDVVLLDWQMLRAGRACSVGGLTRLFTHFMHQDRLILGEITLGDEVDVAGEVVIGPHVHIGDRARIAYRATIAPFCRVGAEAVVHEDAMLGERTQVGEGAVVEARAVVAPGTNIGPRERWGGSPAALLGEVRVRPVRRRAT